MSIADALSVISDYPCPEQDNMNAANMRIIAREALSAAMRNSTALATERAAASMVAALSGPSNELDWRPIGSIPRDGSLVFLWVERPGDNYTRLAGRPGGWHGVDIGRWNSVRGKPDQQRLSGNVTHWAPMARGPRGEVGA